MRSTVVVLLIGLAASACAQKASVAIDATLVKKIEQQVILPPGASALKDYTRFYAPGRINGRDVIEGIYVGGRGPEIFGEAATAVAGPDTAMAVEGIVGAYAMKRGQPLPLIFDGGCGVLEMTFDLKTRKLIVSQTTDIKPPLQNTPQPTAWCHGDA
jgi:hypothetical protein